MFVSLQEKLPYEKCESEFRSTPLLVGDNFTNASDCMRMGSTKYYWYKGNLDVSDDISKSVGLLWHLCLVLLLAWVIVFSVMMKGLAAAGKVRIDTCQSMHDIG